MICELVDSADASYDSFAPVRMLLTSTAECRLVKLSLCGGGVAKC